MFIRLLPTLGVIPGATQLPSEFLSGKVQGCQQNLLSVLANT